MEVTITRDIESPRWYWDGVRAASSQRYDTHWPPIECEDGPAFVRNSPMELPVGTRLLFGGWDQINARSFKDLRYDLVMRFLSVVPEMVPVAKNFGVGHLFLSQTRSYRHLLMDKNRDWATSPRPSYFPPFTAWKNFKT